MQTRRGFTLIELLIVVGIVAVLAVTVVFTLNPAELLRQARDSNRLTDLYTLNKALAILDGETTSASLGTSTTVYVSIPDSSTACANLGLPALPAGYAYGCAPTSTLRSTDGTGWVPVNFSLISSGSPLSALPIDPVNSTSTGLYYTYIPGGSWEINAVPESRKYRILGDKDRASTDGGDNPSLFEIGSNLALNPRKGTPVVSTLKLWFDANYGITKNGTSVSAWKDQSGNDNDATQTNASKQPAFSTNALNGLPAIQVRTNSGSDFLNVANSFLLKQVLIVYKSPNATFNSYGTPLGSNGASATRTFIFQSGDTTFHSNPGCTTGGTWKNGASLTSPCNMASITNYMILTVNTQYPTMSRVYTVGASDTGSYIADLDIAEIIGYDSVLSATDRQAVEGYLNAKYSVY